ncbi:MAG: aspartate aminotransferase family protein [Lachnospiraceae bacterium]|nr:aspartate aminotransferase family protein [Lachnospiraceae bacterium]
MDNMIKKGEECLLHTYNRFPVVFDKAEGVKLYDINGKEYLDFFSGIAVMALGYCHPEYTKRLHEQLDKLTHISNYFYNEPAITAAEKFVKASGMDRVFFTNSGAEAIEGALKMARRYSYDKYGEGRTDVIAVNHSFHGRTMGAVSVTGTEAYRKPFGQMLGGITFAEYNNLDSVKALISDKTCAIILETLQGEGGIHVAEKEFLEGIRAICDEKDIVMILDEVQCGMGRTGKYFAYQHYDILPDIMTSAKGIGNGMPVGAFACKEQFAALVAGDHGSTYGGNPMVTAAINAVFDIYEKEDVLKNVTEVGDYLYNELEKLASENELIVDHRGIGLMQGIELKTEVKKIVGDALDNGLVLISAGNNVIRFLPALIISKEDVDNMISILKKVLA